MGHLECRAVSCAAFQPASIVFLPVNGGERKLRRIGDDDAVGESNIALEPGRIGLGVRPKLNEAQRGELIRALKGGALAAGHCERAMDAAADSEVDQRAFWRRALAAPRVCLNDPAARAPGPQRAGRQFCNTASLDGPKKSQYLP